jgi:hypothetical protein
VRGVSCSPVASVLKDIARSQTDAAKQAQLASALARTLRAAAAEVATIDSAALVVSRIAFNG